MTISGSALQGPARSQISALISRLVPLQEPAGAPFEQYRDHPVEFFREVLGVDPWGRHHGLPGGEASQIDLILSVRDYSAVAVRSGHKVYKAIDVNTPIPTPSGWTTMGDLRFGDFVFDDRGEPCRVTGVSDVFYGRPCFDVEFSDGTIVTADSEHQWLTWSAAARRSTIRAKNPRRHPNVVTTDEIAKTLVSANRGRNHAVKNALPVVCPDRQRKTKSAWVAQREIVAVRARASVPVRCIEVDSPSHTYLCSRAFIPTHNSAAGAGLSLWWVTTRAGGQVILTAPSYDQVRKPIWAEIRSLVAHSHPAQRGKRLPDLLRCGRLNLEPHSGFELGPNWGIWGKATDKPERMAGPSGADVMYVVDEASGYDERLLEAIQGGLAGCGKIVLFGNPTRTSGAFFDAFHEKRDAWKCLHTSSTSTPNFYGRRIPGLADPQWLEGTAKKLWGGPGNPIYDVRVLGKFAGQAPNSIVGLDLLEASKTRWVELERSRPSGSLTREDGRLEVGVDVSRDGEDETVVAARRGLRAFPLSVVTFDPKLVHASPPVPLGHQAALGAVQVARALRRPNEAEDAPRSLRPRIKVDEIGNGAACLDHLLAQFADEFEVVGVKVSQRGDELVRVAPGITAEQYYANKRAQLTFGVRDWMVAGGCVPPDGRLDAELVAATQHQIGNGKTAVEPKDEIKKRLKRSPDRSDALALCCYEPPKPPPRVVTYSGDLTDENDGWGGYSPG